MGGSPFSGGKKKKLHCNIYFLPLLFLGDSQIPLKALSLWSQLRFATNKSYLSLFHISSNFSHSEFDLGDESSIKTNVQGI